MEFSVPISNCFCSGRSHSLSSVKTSSALRPVTITAVRRKGQRNGTASRRRLQTNLTSSLALKCKPHFLPQSKNLTLAPVAARKQGILYRIDGVLLKVNSGLRTSKSLIINHCNFPVQNFACQDSKSVMYDLSLATHNVPLTHLFPFSPSSTISLLWPYSRLNT